MEHKILFWIDDSLIHFGIANSLQNKLNCELYSIIDVTDKKKHFFEILILDSKHQEPDHTIIIVP